MEDQNIDHNVDEATSEGVTEPISGRGLPSYRPWDWIAGFAFAAAIIAFMFALAESSYHM